MNKDRILQNLDKTLVVVFCLYILHIPYSIAVLESLFGFLFLLFVIKRGIIYKSNLTKALKENKELILREKIILLLKSFKPVDNYLNGPIAIYYFVCFLSLLTSQFPYHSLKGVFWKLFEWFFVYFIFVEVFTTKTRIKKFFVVYCLSALLILTNGFYQLLTGKGFMFGHLLSEGRISSSLRHSNDYGAYLIFLCLFLLGLSLYTFIQKKKENNLKQYDEEFPLRWRIAVFVLFILSLLSLGLTLSRGVWLGFFAGLIFLVYQKKKFMYPIIYIMMVLLHLLMNRIDLLKIFYII